MDPTPPLPRRRPAWLPYVAPMAAFLLLTYAESYLPKSGDGVHPTWYPIAYAAKVVVVAVVAWLCRSTWHDLSPWPGPRVLLASFAAGLLVTALWVGLDPYYPRFSWLGTRSEFDPMGLPTAGRATFLVARAFGLVLLVPLIEELFWRSFLMRWVIDSEFTRVPIGRVTPLAAGATAGLFALAHPEWLPALLTGLLWAGLLGWTRSVSACLVSHVTANLALGAYVLATGEWRFL